MTEYLAGLSEDQKNAVLSTQGPTLIYAGAGSGKTATLTKRVAHILKTGLAEPEQIICITFTNKAATEMLLRLRALVGEDLADRMQISTFHSLCARMLRSHGKYVGIPTNFTIYDEDDSKKLIKEAVEDLSLDSKTFPPAVVADAISEAKNALESPTEYYQRHVKSADSNEAIIHSLYLRYSKRLTQCNAIDFDDLLVKAVQLVTRTTEGKEWIKNQYRYVMVDEYQDTNYAQSVLLTSIAKLTGNNLCAIGDPRQSIYGWRGADFKIIMRFTEDYPQAGKHVLAANYRSTKSIVNAAESVIEKNTMRPDYTCFSPGEEGDPVAICRFNDGFDEARGVVSKIVELVGTGQYQYSDFGILFRTNAMSRLFEGALMAAKIPYEIVGALEFFARQEVKDVLAYLRLLLNTDDDVSFARVVNLPTRGCGDTSLKKIRDMADHDEISLWEFSGNEKPDGITPKSWAGYLAFIQEIRRLQNELDKGISLDGLIGQILRVTDLEEHYLTKDKKAGKDRVANVEELITAASDFKGPAKDKLEEFLERVTLSANTSRDGGNNVVSIMSMHQCKGLEFPVVFLTGMEDGILPHDRCLGNPDTLEEERRLCYVGMTRAKKLLYLSYASERNRFGKFMYSAPSRFLREIDKKYIVESW